ncbi:hypothetical protein QBE53_15375 [Vallitaleaceae bacterium 9-2]
MRKIELNMKEHYKKDFNRIDTALIDIEEAPFPPSPLFLLW